MTYSRRNIAEEQKEASQKAKQITTLYEQLSITVGPIDWLHAGMRARVTVNAIEISDLLDLSQQNSDSLLRRVQIKLLEHAALEAVGAQPGHKALIWSPVDVVQPQAFLSLWVVTLDTYQRIAIAEYIREGHRVYEHYHLNMQDEQVLAKLFGPLSTGEYTLGDIVSFEQHGQRYTGKIVHILPPSKAALSRKSPPGTRHSVSGKAYLNDSLSRYIIDCHDSFPYIVQQWQVVNETNEG